METNKVDNTKMKMNQIREAEKKRWGV